MKNFNNLIPNSKTNTESVVINPNIPKPSRKEDDLMKMLYNNQSKGVSETIKRISENLSHPNTQVVKK